jgi:hypothetical protein
VCEVAGGRSVVLVGGPAGGVRVGGRSCEGRR